MGAAASIQLLYRSAGVWFKEYFTTEQYILDYREISASNTDGVICLQDFQRWLANKTISLGPHWQNLLASNEVLALAFEYSCLHLRRSTVMGKRVVDMVHFRSLLVHVYVVAVLRSLFHRADSMVEGENFDAFNNKLCFEEFSFAMRSFTSSYGGKELSDREIRQDFEMLGPDGEGHVHFDTVCALCTKFVDPMFTQKFSVATTYETRCALLKHDQSALQAAVAAKVGVSDSTDRVSLSMTEAPIELIIELQSIPSEEERDLLPEFMSSTSCSSGSFDAYDTDKNTPMMLMKKSTRRASDMPLSSTQSSSYISTRQLRHEDSLSLNNHNNNNGSTSGNYKDDQHDHQVARHVRVVEAMECLATKIARDLETADLIALRLSTWSQLSSLLDGSCLASSSSSPSFTMKRSFVLSAKSPLHSALSSFRLNSVRHADTDDSNNNNNNSQHFFASEVVSDPLTVMLETDEHETVV